MGSFEYLKVEVGDTNIAVVQLNRPPVNAVNQVMYREIRRAFEDLSARGDVKIAILSGQGKHFCAGNDLDEFMTLTPENASARMLEVRESYWAMLDSPFPIIAAVHGVAVGTGLALVASCDFAIAAKGAKFGVPEVSVGVMGGARHLMRLLPHPVVRSMFFSSDPAPVEELVRLGGLVAVVPPDQLMTEARRRAELIARHSIVAIRYAKRSLNEAEFMDLRSGYEREQAYTGELSGYADSKEAITAFFERRPPVYTGS